MFCLHCSVVGVHVLVGVSEVTIVDEIATTIKINEASQEGSLR